MAHYFSKHDRLSLHLTEGIVQFVRGAFTTSNEDMTKALESHPWFNQKFFKVENVRTNPGPQVSIGGVTSEDKAKFDAALQSKDARIAELEAKLASMQTVAAPTAEAPVEATAESQEAAPNKKEKVKKQ